jgi:head-tail adaptor
VPVASPVGARTKFVRIEQMTETVVDGFNVEQWITLTSMFMARRDLQGSERFMAAQLQAHYETEWRMPYDARMDPERIDVPKYRRLMYANRIYDIVTGTVGDMRSEIVLLTKAASRVES